MLLIVGEGIAEKESLPALRARPALRKATEQMLWALSAAETALAGTAAISRDRLGLVVGSGQGELETTKEFYRALAREDLARPFLFQNSLHHSTAGLLSQALGIRGPAATVSDSFFSGEAALELARDFLGAALCEACLVIGVDTLVPDLDYGVRARYPAGLARGEGAAALLLASPEAAAALALPASFRIEALRRCERQSRIRPELPGYYEADALQRLLESPRRGTLLLGKPDGQACQLELGGEA